MVSVRELLTFHKQERRAYEMLVARAPASARRILGLWLWLDLLGIDILALVCDCRNQSVVKSMIDEALRILGRLRQDAPVLTNAEVTIPLTASLAVEPLNLQFFDYHIDHAVRGIAKILDGVGKLIFDDHLNASLRAYESGALGDLPEELARPYDLTAVPSPVDARSLFITFSPAFPLSREDIAIYFTGAVDLVVSRRWGRCIESVTLESEAGLKPMYGLVVFASESAVGLVVGEEKLVRFLIDGKPLWARKCGN